MQYKILTSTDTDDLTTQITTAIADGWTPLGGLCYDDAVYLQVMIKN